MPISLFGSASTPTTDGGTNTSTTVSITPPGSMEANDYVVVLANFRGSGTITNTTTGGQSWTAETQINAANVYTRLFHCRFDGTWDADPVFTSSGSAHAFTGTMYVIRGVDTTTAFDVSPTGSTFAAPSTPYDVTIPGINIQTAGALALMIWAILDDNTWALQTGGWTNTLGTQIRNNGTSSDDNCISTAYQIFSSTGGTGDVTNRESGSDAGVYYSMALKPQAGGGTFNETVTLTGASSITNYGRPMVMSSSVTLAGNTTISNNGPTIRNALFSLIGNANDTESSSRSFDASFSLSGNTSLSNLGPLNINPSLTFTGNATVSNIANAIFNVVSSLEGVASINHLSSNIINSSFSLTGNTIETNSALRDVNTILALTGNATVSNIGPLVINTILSLAGNSVVVFDGALEEEGQNYHDIFYLNGVGTITNSSQIITNPAITFVGNATVDLIGGIISVNNIISLIGDGTINYSALFSYINSLTLEGISQGTFGSSLETNVLLSLTADGQISLVLPGALRKSISRLFNLHLRIDVKRETDSGQGTANSSDSGGTVFYFNKTFKDIDAITVTVKQTVRRFVVVDFVDAPDPTSFKVLVFDESGTRVTETIYWIARGIV